jgi:hypothetical protein
VIANLALIYSNRSHFICRFWRACFALHPCRLVNWLLPQGWG